MNMNLQARAHGETPMGGGRVGQKDLLYLIQFSWPASLCSEAGSVDGILYQDVWQTQKNPKDMGFTEAR